MGRDEYKRKDFKIFSRSKPTILVSGSKYLNSLQNFLKIINYSYMIIMGKGKKATFSKEEKQIIHNMKNQLSIMSVPREEWSKIIQEEINLHRQMKSKSSKKKSRIGKFFEKIWKKIVKSFFKLTSKEYRKNSEEFDQMFEMMENAQKEGDLSQKEDVLGMFNSIPEREDLDSLGNNYGTFIVDRKDKKKKLVEFDDDL